MRGVMRNWPGALLVVASLPSEATLARAQSGKWTDDIEVHGFVSFAGVANFNRPEPIGDDSFARNQFRAFDTMANTLSLDVATLTVERVPETPHDLGVRIDVAAGQTVPQGEKAAGSSAGPFDLQRAYLWFALESGFRFDLGKWASPAGPEVIEGFENVNDHYSHSFAFTYGPKTHTGVKATYASTYVTVAALVTTGWDTLVDDNTALSFGGLVLVTPTAGVTLQILYLGGKEDPDPDPPFRHFVDAYATVTIAPWLRAVLHGHVGHEGDASWGGAAGYLTFTPPGDYSVALRGELFDDGDGARTLVAGGQTLGEISLTGSYKFGTHHVARLEFRLDRSSEAVFGTHDGVSRNQVTLAANYLGRF